MIPFRYRRLAGCVVLEVPGAIHVIRGTRTTVQAWRVAMRLLRRLEERLC